MKERTGFVSNSSSSSFIISHKKSTPLKVMVEMDLTSVIDKEINTKEEAENYIKSEFGWKDMTLNDILEDDDYAREQYESILEGLKRKETVYIISGSSEDYDGVGSYIYNSGLKGMQGITIIRGEE